MAEVVKNERLPRKGFSAVFFLRFSDFLLLRLRSAAPRAPGPAPPAAAAAARAVRSAVTPWRHAAADATQVTAPARIKAT